MILLNKKYKILINTFLSPQWEHGLKILYLTILFSFSLISYYNLYKGFVMSSDSLWYSDAANDLIKLNFNLLTYYFQNTHIIPSFFYTFPVFIIALLKLLFGAEWQNAFMTFNLIIVFFSILLFSKSLLLLKVRPLVISIAILFLPLSIDLLTWPRFILTDMLFSFLVVFMVYVITKMIALGNNYNFLFVLLLILMFLTRPTSLVFILVFSLFILLLKLKINYSPKLILLIVSSIFIFTPIVLAISFQLMKFYMNSYPQISFITQMVESGMVIKGRPETWIEKPDTFFEIINLYYVRLCYFFTPYIKGFSTVHNIFNLIQTFILSLSIIIWFFLGEKFKLINKTIMLILLITICVAGFHSFTLIDYDFRYRFPLIMPLMIIFPLAFEVYLRKILYRNIEY